MEYKYKPNIVCAREIIFDINDDIITNIHFVGGCNGNLKAIAKLVDGYNVDKIEKFLLGNTCGFKNTSCADQLAKAVRKAYNDTHK